ncbi:membrane protein [Lampropedia cohaerens]|uniref:Membrane protein n=1 Tax=Lampropedia cohaerens TaxID=1610491 RepID=A0A0U1PY90_9BURK|nr:membrane protein [Lampropedia cohaerens]KKW67484.1 membrane protein [Lampropedia cohaerens]
MTHDHRRTTPSPAASHAVQVELVAVLAAVSNGQPRILTTQHGQALPCGPFTQTHRSLQQAMRAWIESETQHPVGYIEQLYTFADPGRPRDALDDAHGPAARHISISYLGLTREARSPHDTLNAAADHAGWRNWYDYFPWEDRRSDWAEALLAEHIAPALQRWICAAPDAATRNVRSERMVSYFGLQGVAWNEDLVLQRYELLYEAQLVPEAWRSSPGQPAAPLVPGAAMQLDHRRILATGMARLRAKLKYRPVVFELMPAEFTLLQLQQTAEAITGRWLHKQNFRRLIEQQEVIEETGGMDTSGSGRPAKLFRFRSGITHERAIAGTKLPVANSH